MEPHHTTVTSGCTALDGSPGTRVTCSCGMEHTCYADTHAVADLRAARLAERHHRATSSA